MDALNKIYLATEKELRIYMLPLRQRIVRAFRILGQPTTAKHIADMLGITPSSAQHHIKKLMEIGVIEHDHNEMINGITARYLRVSNRTVVLGLNRDDGLSSLRDILSENILLNIYAGCRTTVEKARKANADEYESHQWGDMLSGIVHLDARQAAELFQIIQGYLAAHETVGTDTHPWEYALIAYRTDTEDKP